MLGPLFFQNRFWIVYGALVGVSAFFSARILTTALAMGLAADENELLTPTMESRPLLQAASQSRHRTSAELIISRNPFDSVTGPLNPTIDENEVSAPDLSDPANAPACDGVKVLIIASSTDPDWSFAAFGGEGGKSVLARRGQEINGKKVQFVGWDRVWLASGSSLCQAIMFSAGFQPKVNMSPSADLAPAQISKGSQGVDPAIAKGIRKISSREFEVERGVVDRILENQAELMKTARIVPEQENGKVLGIKLFGIKSDSLLGMLGLENGDRLQSINGFDMGSPEKALEAYARLRTAEKLTISVNRRGQNQNIDFNIK